MHAEIAVRILRSGRPQGVVRISKRGAIIGSDAHADIRLDDGQVSRVHARVEHDGERFRIHDLISATGTWLQDLEISDHRLREDDRVRIGPFELRFSYDGLAGLDAPLLDGGRPELSGLD